MTGDFSRITLGTFGIVSTGLLYAEHILLKISLRDSQGLRTQKRRLILVSNSSDSAGKFAKALLQDPLSGYELLGRVDPYEKKGNESAADTGTLGEKKESLETANLRKKTNFIGADSYDISILCAFEDLPAYLQTNWVDEVLILLAPGQPVPEELLDLCSEMGITTHLQLATGSRRACQQAVEQIGGYTFLTESVRMASFTERFIKRTIDILGAIVGIVITLFLFVLIAPFIFFSDPGPILFSQVRIGENGRKFKLYKFRSMYRDAEKRKADLLDKNQMSGNMFKMDNDPRILGSGPDGTRHGIGWFIRKTSIDEFPQFWNVLKGDMSLVGTRPPTVDEWEKYEAHHRARLSIRPGITGLWQVSGRNNITDFEKVIALDMEYINNWNIGMDIRIILKTIGVLFSGNGAK